MNLLKKQEGILKVENVSQSKIFILNKNNLINLETKNILFYYVKKAVVIFNNYNNFFNFANCSCLFTFLNLRADSVKY